MIINKRIFTEKFTLMILDPVYTIPDLRSHDIGQFAVIIYFHHFFRE